MNTPRDHDFDARLRQLHGEALQQVSPRTRAQLALRQSAATSRRRASSRRPAWVLASACAIGALALGLAWRVRPPSAPAPEPIDAAIATPARINDSDDSGDAYAVFDESPDLYLWLDSDEAMAVLE